MKDKIIIITKPSEQFNLRSHFGVCSKYNMNPCWYLKKRKGQYDQYIVVRPARTDDPPIIVSSLKKLKTEGWVEAFPWAKGIICNPFENMEAKR